MARTWGSVGVVAVVCFLLGWWARPPDEPRLEPEAPRRAAARALPPHIAAPPAEERAPDAADPRSAQRQADAVLHVEYLDALDERVDTESSDPSWSPAGELREVIAEIGGQTREVKCASSLCRATLRFASPDAMNDALGELGPAATFAASISFRHHAEPAQVTAYFMRPDEAGPPRREP